MGRRVEGNEKRDMDNWRVIIRGISDAKDGSMHVYGFHARAIGAHTHLYTRAGAYIHTHPQNTGKTIVTWQAVILDTYLVLSVRKHS